MQDLAIKLRCSQFVAHACHNKVKGPMFLEYHEYLGELYGIYEGLYDDVVERMIGLGIDADPSALTKAAADKAEEAEVYDGDALGMFSYLNDCEKEIRSLAEGLNEGATFGSKNFLQGIADESEKRSYKLGQILKNDSGSPSPKAYSAPILRMVKPSRIIGA